MILYYFLWWLIWTAERLPNSFESVPSHDPKDLDPQNLSNYAESLASIYYFLAFDLCTNCCVLVMSDINWIPHSLVLICYAITQIFHIYFYFESTMIQSFTLACVIALIFLFTSNYLRIKASKHSFLQSKKIKMLLR